MFANICKDPVYVEHNPFSCISELDLKQQL